MRIIFLRLRSRVLPGRDSGRQRERNARQPSLKTRQRQSCSDNVRCFDSIMSLTAIQGSFDERAGLWNGDIQLHRSSPCVKGPMELRPL